MIEALRGYFAARGRRAFCDDLAENWYREQLFPPTRRQFLRAVRFMHKTADGGARVRQPSPAGSGASTDRRSAASARSRRA